MYESIPIRYFFRIVIIIPFTPNWCLNENQVFAQELRSSKSEAMTKTLSASMSKTSCFQAVGFCHLNIRYPYLFRISKLDIRVLAEQGFPFSH